MLSAVIITLVKLKPGLDDYFRKGTPILKEIDDLIDAILLEFPNNDTLNTISDILDKIISELKEAGYKIDEEQKKKIENRLKAKIRREGIEIELNNETNEYSIRLN
ncbi:hypothetical protein [Halanaerobaculum tunisiense]